MDGESIIQIMEEKDLEQVVELQSKVYYAVLPESKESFQDKLLLSPTTHWIVKHDFELVAYLVAIPIKYNNPPLLNETNYTSYSNPDTLYIHDLSVVTDKQGMQFGSMLVNKAIDTAKSKKFTYISLIAVQESNRFWNKLGFRICKTLPKELNSKIKSYGVDAQYMDIKLS